MNPTSATFCLLLTLLNSPSSVNSSTVLSKRIVAFVLPVHSLRALMQSAIVWFQVPFRITTTSRLFCILEPPDQVGLVLNKMSDVVKVFVQSRDVRRNSVRFLHDGLGRPGGCRNVPLDVPKAPRALAKSVNPLVHRFHLAVQLLERLVCAFVAAVCSLIALTSTVCSSRNHVSTPAINTFSAYDSSLTHVSSAHVDNSLERRPSCSSIFAEATPSTQVRRLPDKHRRPCCCFLLSTWFCSKG